MPIYEYRCGSCQEITEVLQKMSDPPPESCPHCQGKTLTKVMSQTSFVLKGGGWYVTDFKDKHKGPEKNQTEKNQTEKNQTEKNQTEKNQTEEKKEDNPHTPSEGKKEESKKDTSQPKASSSEP